MSANPPAAAFTAARKRQQSATEALAPGSIKIGGTAYACGVKTAARQIRLVDGGFLTVMGFAASVDKTVLATAPVVGTIAIIDTLGFKITEVGGLQSFDTAWVLRGERVPGQDE